MYFFAFILVTPKMLIWLLFLLLSFYYVFHQYFQLIWLQLIGRLPPGPVPLPVVGNGFAINSEKPFESLEKLADKYGKIFSVSMGNQLTVYIADLEVLRKAFRDDRFSARPDSVWNHLGFSGGISLADGPVYREHRRFAIQTFKDYGLGHKSGEELIQKEAANLLSELRKTNGSYFHNHLVLSGAVSNVVAHALFGERFDTNDPHFVEYIEQEAENFKYAAGGSLIETYPGLRFVPPFRGKFRQMQKEIQAQRSRLQELIDVHKSSFDPVNPRDYIDAYLVRQNTGVSSFTDDQLLSNVADLYGAALETTTTFLRWAMLFMIAYPEVQRMVQKELDSVVGRVRMVGKSDCVNLPYLEAVIYEVFRLANFLPFLLPHKTSSTVELEGYTLPKDASVIGLAWAIHRDPALWNDPEVFRPERFLTQNNTLNTTATDRIIIFSVGRRICPGEQFAHLEAFIFLGSILQHFELSGEEGIVPSFVPVNGLTLTPEPYRMCALAVWPGTNQ